MIEPIPKVAKRPRAGSETTYRNSVQKQVIERAGLRWRGHQGEALCERCAADVGIEMHEGRFRSQTRNMPPEHRFSTKWCLWVCRRCHNLLQEHDLNIFCRSLNDGCDGLVLFLPGKVVPSNWHPILDVWCHVTGR